MIHKLTNYSGTVSDIPSGSIYGIYFLTFYSGILSDILFWHFILAFHVASILTSYLASFLASILTSYLASFLASILTSYLASFLASLTFSLTWVLPDLNRERQISVGSAHFSWSPAAGEGGEGGRHAPLIQSRDLTWQVGNNIDLKPPTMYPLHFMYMLLVYLHMSICLLFSAWTDGISHVPTFLMVFQDESDAVLRFSIFFCFWCVPWSTHGIRGMVIHPIMGVL